MSWYAALGLAVAGTYLMRAVSVTALADRELSVRTQRAFRHASIGILAAMAVSSTPGGDAHLVTAAVVGLGATALAAWRWSHITLAMAIGIAAFWIIDLVMV